MDFEIGKVVRGLSMHVMLRISTLASMLGEDPPDKDHDQAAECSFDHDGRQQIKDSLSPSRINRNDGPLPNQSKSHDDALAQQDQKRRGSIAHFRHLFSQPACDQCRNGKGEQKASRASLKMNPA